MKTEKIEIRLTAEQKADVQSIANEYGWSISSLVKQSIVSFMYDQLGDTEETAKRVRIYMQ